MGRQACRQAGRQTGTPESTSLRHAWRTFGSSAPLPPQQAALPSLPPLGDEAPAAAAPTPVSSVQPPALPFALRFLLPPPSSPATRPPPPDQHRSSLSIPRQRGGGGETPFEPAAARARPIGWRRPSAPVSNVVGGTRIANLRVIERNGRGGGGGRRVCKWLGLTYYNLPRTDCALSRWLES